MPGTQGLRAALPGEPRELLPYLPPGEPFELNPVARGPGNCTCKLVAAEGLAQLGTLRTSVGLRLLTCAESWTRRRRAGATS